MVVGTLQAKSPELGGWRVGADEAAAGHIVPALVSRSSRGKPTPLAPGHNGTDEHVTVVGALKSSEQGSHGMSAETAADGRLIANTLTSGSRRRGISAAGRRQEDDWNLAVSHTLTSAGFDASEDGTGRGTPLVPDGVRAPDGLAGWMDGPVSAFDPRPDGQRYAACGDGVVAPVAEWIARRLASAAFDEPAASGTIDGIAALGETRNTTNDPQ